MKNLIIELSIVCVLGVLAALCIHEIFADDPVEPKVTTVKVEAGKVEPTGALALPLGMVFLQQCGRPLAFFGFDTAGRMYWVDATQMDMRHLLVLKQAVDQNHYWEKVIPCRGHYANQPPSREF
jgi:hypothetical protein